jgi:hypothetical protein
MLRKSLVVLGTLFTLAACTDGRDPFAPEIGQFAITQSGNGSAYHGYAAPALQLQSSDTQLCAQWGDPSELSAKLGEIGGPAANHFSYDFALEENDDWTNLDDIKVNNASDRACLDIASVQLPARIRVVGMAKSGTGQETTTHHTLPAYQLLGSSYSVQAIGGNCQTGTAPNVNAATWNLTFQLYSGTTLVTDGKAVYVNGNLANYDADTNAYHINNSGGETGSVVWNFNVDSATGPSASSFTCSAPVSNTARGKK